MKTFFYLIILLFLQNCSFDNKSGIWKNQNDTSVKKNDDSFKEFKDLSLSKEPFNKEIPLKKGFKFTLPKIKTVLEWTDVYYQKNNNFSNFKYTNLNEKIFNSRKISKYKTNKDILFYDEKIITSDLRGNLIIFSIPDNKVLFKYNFYKKKYKNIKKTLNIILEGDLIYISDNIGYLYTFSLKEGKILWAKNYKVPFRSNLKISGNKLMAASQNNNLFFFDKFNGNILRSIPTEETIMTNKFVNNLSLSNEKLFF